MVTKVKNKWDKLDDNTQKWAKRLTSIATIIGVLVAGGGWIINQLDNAVATRLEEQTTSLQQEVESLSKGREQADHQTELQLTRLELMMLMAHAPENIVEIEKIARHYFVDLKGDTYMTSEYTKWAKSYGGDMEYVIEYK